MCQQGRITHIFHHYICGYQLAQLASNKYDGVICRQPYENIWDVAAGTLLISEAGGKVVNLNKDSYDVRDLDFFAGSNELYHELKQKEVV